MASSLTAHFSQGSLNEYEPKLLPLPSIVLKNDQNQSLQISYDLIAKAESVGPAEETSEILQEYFRLSPVKDEVYARALMMEATVVMRKAISISDIDMLKTALGIMLEAGILSSTLQASSPTELSYLVYNAAIHHWFIVRHIVRAGVFTVIPSLEYFLGKIQNDLLLQARYLITLAICHQAVGSIDKAIICSAEALSLLSRSNDLYQKEFATKSDVNGYLYSPIQLMHDEALSVHAHAVLTKELSNTTLSRGNTHLVQDVDTKASALLGRLTVPTTIGPAGNHSTSNTGLNDLLVSIQSLLTLTGLPHLSDLSSSELALGVNVASCLTISSQHSWIGNETSAVAAGASSMNISSKKPTSGTPQVAVDSSVNASGFRKALSLTQSQVKQLILNLIQRLEPRLHSYLASPLPSNSREALKYSTIVVPTGTFLSKPTSTSSRSLFLLSLISVCAARANLHDLSAKLSKAMKILTADYTAAAAAAVSTSVNEGHEDSLDPSSTRGLMSRPSTIVGAVSAAHNTEKSYVEEAVWLGQLAEAITLASGGDERDYALHSGSFLVVPDTEAQILDKRVHVLDSLHPEPQEVKDLVKEKEKEKDKGKKAPASQKAAAAPPLLASHSTPTGAPKPTGTRITRRHSIAVAERTLTLIPPTVTPLHEALTLGAPGASSASAAVLSMQAALSQPSGRRNSFSGLAPVALALVQSQSASARAAQGDRVRHALAPVWSSVFPTLEPQGLPGAQAMRAERRAIALKNLAVIVQESRLCTDLAATLILNISTAASHPEAPLALQHAVLGAASAAARALDASGSLLHGLRLRLHCTAAEAAFAAGRDADARAFARSARAIARLTSTQCPPGIELLLRITAGAGDVAADLSELRAQTHAHYFGSSNGLHSVLSVHLGSRASSGAAASLSSQPGPQAARQELKQGFRTLMTARATMAKEGVSGSARELLTVLAADARARGAQALALIAPVVPKLHAFAAARSLAPSDSTNIPPEAPPLPGSAAGSKTRKEPSATVLQEAAELVRPALMLLIRALEIQALLGEWNSVAAAAARACAALRGTVLEGALPQLTASPGSTAHTGPPDGAPQTVLALYPDISKQLLFLRMLEIEAIQRQVEAALTEAKASSIVARLQVYSIAVRRSILQRLLVALVLARALAAGEAVPAVLAVEHVSVGGADDRSEDIEGAELLRSPDFASNEAFVVNDISASLDARPNSANLRPSSRPRSSNAKGKDAEKEKVGDNDLDDAELESMMDGYPVRSHWDAFSFIFDERRQQIVISVKEGLPVLIPFNHPNFHTSPASAGTTTTSSAPLVAKGKPTAVKGSSKDKAAGNEQEKDASAERPLRREESRWVYPLQYTVPLQSLERDKFPLEVLFPSLSSASAPSSSAASATLQPLLPTFPESATALGSFVPGVPADVTHLKLRLVQRFAEAAQAAERAGLLLQLENVCDRFTAVYSYVSGGGLASSALPSLAPVATDLLQRLARMGSRRESTMLSLALLSAAVQERRCMLQKLHEDAGLVFVPPPSDSSTSVSLASTSAPGTSSAKSRPGSSSGKAKEKSCLRPRVVPFGTWRVAVHSNEAKEGVLAPSSIPAAPPGEWDTESALRRKYSVLLPRNRASALLSVYGGMYESLLECAEYEDSLMESDPDGLGIPESTSNSAMDAGTAGGSSRGRRGSISLLSAMSPIATSYPSLGTYNPLSDESDDVGNIDEADENEENLPPVLRLFDSLSLGRSIYIISTTGSTTTSMGAAESSSAHAPHTVHADNVSLALQSDLAETPLIQQLRSTENHSSVMFRNLHSFVRSAMLLLTASSSCPIAPLATVTDALDALSSLASLSMRAQFCGSYGLPYCSLKPPRPHVSAPVAASAASGQGSKPPRAQSAGKAKSAGDKDKDKEKEMCGLKVNEVPSFQQHFPRIEFTVDAPLFPSFVLCVQLEAAASLLSTGAYDHCNHHTLWNLSKLIKSLLFHVHDEFQRFVGLVFGPAPELELWQNSLWLGALGEIPPTPAQTLYTSASLATPAQSSSRPPSSSAKRPSSSSASARGATAAVPAAAAAATGPSLPPQDSTSRTNPFPVDPALLQFFKLPSSVGTISATGIPSNSLVYPSPAGLAALAHHHSSRLSAPSAASSRPSSALSVKGKRPAAGSASSVGENDAETFLRALRALYPFVDEAALEAVLAAPSLVPTVSGKVGQAFARFGGLFALQVLPAGSLPLAVAPFVVPLRASSPYRSLQGRVDDLVAVGMGIGAAAERAAQRAAASTQLFCTFSTLLASFSRVAALPALHLFEVLLEYSRAASDARARKEDVNGSLADPSPADIVPKSSLKDKDGEKDEESGDISLEASELLTELLVEARDVSVLAVRVVDLGDSLLALSLNKPAEALTFDANYEPLGPLQAHAHRLRVQARSESLLSGSLVDLLTARFFAFSGAFSSPLDAVPLLVRALGATARAAIAALRASNVRGVVRSAEFAAELVRQVFSSSGLDLVTAAEVVQLPLRVVVRALRFLLPHGLIKFSTAKIEQNLDPSRDDPHSAPKNIPPLSALTSFVQTTQAETHKRIQSLFTALVSRLLDCCVFRLRFEEGRSLLLNSLALLPPSAAANELIERGCLCLIRNSHSSGTDSRLQDFINVTAHANDNAGKLRVCMRVLEFALLDNGGSSAFASTSTAGPSVSIEPTDSSPGIPQFSAVPSTFTEFQVPYDEAERSIRIYLNIHDVLTEPEIFTYHSSKSSAASSQPSVSLDAFAPALSNPIASSADGSNLDLFTSPPQLRAPARFSLSSGLMAFGLPTGASSSTTRSVRTGYSGVTGTASAGGRAGAAGSGSMSPEIVDHAFETALSVLEPSVSKALLLVKRLEWMTEHHRASDHIMAIANEAENILMTLGAYGYSAAPAQTSAVLPSGRSGAPQTDKNKDILMAFRRIIRTSVFASSVPDHRTSDAEESTFRYRQGRRNSLVAQGSVQAPVQASAHGSVRESAFGSGVPPRAAALSLQSPAGAASVFGSARGAVAGGERQKRRGSLGGGSVMAETLISRARASSVASLVSQELAALGLGDPASLEEQGSSFEGYSEAQQLNMRMVDVARMWFSALPFLLLTRIYCHALRLGRNSRDVRWKLGRLHEFLDVAFSRYLPPIRRSEVRSHALLNIGTEKDSKEVKESKERKEDESYEDEPVKSTPIDIFANIIYNSELNAAEMEGISSADDIKLWLAPITTYPVRSYRRLATLLQGYFHSRRHRTLVSTFGSSNYSASQEQDVLAILSVSKQSTPSSSSVTVAGGGKERTQDSAKEDDLLRGSNRISVLRDASPGVLPTILTLLSSIDLTLEASLAYNAADMESMAGSISSALLLAVSLFYDSISAKKVHAISSSNSTGSASQTNPLRPLAQSMQALFLHYFALVASSVVPINSPSGGLGSHKHLNKVLQELELEFLGSAGVSPSVETLTRLVSAFSVATTSSASSSTISASSLASFAPAPLQNLHDMFVLLLRALVQRHQRLWQLAGQPGAGPGSGPSTWVLLGRTRGAIARTLRALTASQFANFLARKDYSRLVISSAAAALASSASPRVREIVPITPFVPGTAGPRSGSLFILELTANLLQSLSQRSHSAAVPCASALQSVQEVLRPLEQEILPAVESSEAAEFLVLRAAALCRLQLAAFYARWALRAHARRLAAARSASETAKHGDLMALGYSQMFTNVDIALSTANAPSMRLSGLGGLVSLALARMLLSASPLSPLFSFAYSLKVRRGVLDAQLSGYTEEVSKRLATLSQLFLPAGTRSAPVTIPVVSTLPQILLNPMLASQVSSLTQTRLKTSLLCVLLLAHSAGSFQATATSASAANTSQNPSGVVSCGPSPLNEELLRHATSLLMTTAATYTHYSIATFYAITRRLSLESPLDPIQRHLYELDLMIPAELSRRSSNDGSTFPGDLHDVTTSLECAGFFPLSASAAESLIKTVFPSHSTQVEDYEDPRLSTSLLSLTQLAAYERIVLNRLTVPRFAGAGDSELLEEQNLDVQVEVHEQEKEQVGLSGGIDAPIQKHFMNAIKQAYDHSVVSVYAHFYGSNKLPADMSGSHHNLFEKYRETLSFSLFSADPLAGSPSVASKAAKGKPAAAKDKDKEKEKEKAKEKEKKRPISSSSSSRPMSSGRTTADVVIPLEGGVSLVAALLSPLWARVLEQEASLLSRLASSSPRNPLVAGESLRRRFRDISAALPALRALQRSLSHSETAACASASTLPPSDALIASLGSPSLYFMGGVTAPVVSCAASVSGPDQLSLLAQLARLAGNRVPVLGALAQLQLQARRAQQDARLLFDLHGLPRPQLQHAVMGADTDPVAVLASAPEATFLSTLCVCPDSPFTLLFSVLARTSMADATTGGVHGLPPRPSSRALNSPPLVAEPHSEPEVQPLDLTPGLVALNSRLAMSESEFCELTAICERLRVAPLVLKEHVFLRCGGLAGSFAVPGPAETYASQLDSFFEQAVRDLERLLAPLLEPVHMLLQNSLQKTEGAAPPVRLVLMADRLLFPLPLERTRFFRGVLVSRDFSIATLSHRMGLRGCRSGALSAGLRSPHGGILDATQGGLCVLDPFLTDSADSGGAFKTAKLTQAIQSPASVLQASSRFPRNADALFFDLVGFPGATEVPSTVADAPTSSSAVKDVKKGGSASLKGIHTAGKDAAIRPTSPVPRQRVLVRADFEESLVQQMSAPFLHSALAIPFASSTIAGDLPAKDKKGAKDKDKEREKDADQEEKLRAEDVLVEEPLIASWPLVNAPGASSGPRTAKDMAKLLLDPVTLLSTRATAQRASGTNSNTLTLLYSPESLFDSVNTFDFLAQSIVRLQAASGRPAHPLDSFSSDDPNLSVLIDVGNFSTSRSMDTFLLARKMATSSFGNDTRKKRRNSVSYNNEKEIAISNAPIVPVNSLPIEIAGVWEQQLIQSNFLSAGTSNTIGSGKRFIFASSSSIPKEFAEFVVHIIANSIKYDNDESRLITIDGVIQKIFEMNYQFIDGNCAPIREYLKASFVSFGIGDVVIKSS